MALGGEIPVSPNIWLIVWPVLLLVLAAVLVVCLIVAVRRGVSEREALRPEIPERQLGQLDEAEGADERRLDARPQLALAVIDPQAKLHVAVPLEEDRPVLLRADQWAWRSSASSS